MLHGDTFAPFLLIVTLNRIGRRDNDGMVSFGFQVRARHGNQIPELMTKVLDFVDYIALWWSHSKRLKLCLIQLI